MRANEIDPSEILKTQNADAALKYAVNAGRRWPAAERFIINDLLVAAEYEDKIMGFGKWPAYRARLAESRDQFFRVYGEKINKKKNADIYSEQVFNDCFNGDIQLCAWLGGGDGPEWTRRQNDFRKLLEKDFLTLTDMEISDYMWEVLTTTDTGYFDIEELNENPELLDMLRDWSGRSITFEYMEQVPEISDKSMRYLMDYMAYSAASWVSEIALGALSVSYGNSYVMGR